MVEEKKFRYNFFYMIQKLASIRFKIPDFGQLAF